MKTFAAYIALPAAVSTAMAIHKDTLATLAKSYINPVNSLPLVDLLVVGSTAIGACFYLSHKLPSKKNKIGFLLASTTCLLAAFSLTQYYYNYSTELNKQGKLVNTETNINSAFTFAHRDTTPAQFAKIFPINPLKFFYGFAALTGISGVMMYVADSLNTKLSKLKRSIAGLITKHANTQVADDLITLSQELDGPLTPPPSTGTPGGSIFAMNMPQPANPLQAQLDGATALSAQQAQQIQAQGQQIGDLTVQRDQARDLSAQQARQIDDLTGELGQARAQVQTHGQEIQGLRGELGQARDLSAQQAQQIGDLTNERDQAQAQVQTQGREISSLTGQLSQAQALSARQAQQIGDLTNERDQARAQLTNEQTQAEQQSTRLQQEIDRLTALGTQTKRGGKRTDHPAKTSDDEHETDREGDTDMTNGSLSPARISTSTVASDDSQPSQPPLRRTTRNGAGNRGASFPFSPTAEAVKDKSRRDQGPYTTAMSQSRGTKASVQGRTTIALTR